MSESIRARMGALLVATFAAILVAACDRAPQVDATPEAQPPAEATPGDVTPDTAPPGDMPAPEESPAAPAQPSPDAPPPADPTPTPTPTSLASEPPLDRMQPARASAKLGVPVDLKYSFDTAPIPDQPVTLHLAAIPRVPGANLELGVKNVAGLQVASAGKLSIHKASANDAYREQMSITREAGVSELRVLVTMELPEGLAHGYYSIPFEPDTKSRKQESVKQP